MAEILTQRISSPSPQLEERLDADQFRQLLAVFNSRHPRTQAEKRMSTSEFRSKLARLLGREEADETVAALCARVDSEDQGYISEEEFCSHILRYLQEKDSLAQSHSLPFQDPPTFRHSPSSKEPLCGLMAAVNPPRYITVSKDGFLSSWSPSLQPQGGKMVGGGGRGGASAVHVTDCAVMNDCNKLVIATTSRELMFFDLTTTAYKCLYRVHDMPYMSLCLSYYNSPEAPSSLLYGDEAGVVTLLTFLSPHLSLFHHPPGEGRRTERPTLLIAYSHLATEHRSYLNVQVVPGSHGDWVRRVQYNSHNQSVLSCSGSSSHSLLFRDVGKKRKTYSFRIRKGVICFDYSHSLELLVTGGVDHLVRLWNPYVPSKPTAILNSHSAPVLDVLIHRDTGLVFSISQDLVLCAWDIYGHHLVQTISIKFPFTQRQPDFGPSILHALRADELTVLCNEYIAELRLTVSTTAGGTTRSPTTSHTHPVTAVLYNPRTHQVVSGCEGGVVNVWNVGSGRHILRFTDCHGNHEITAMAFDATGKRLITASQSGEIKVWEYMNRTCLKVMSVPGGTEVTGLMHLLDKSRFLAVGWNRRIATFPDTPDVFHERPDQYWQGENHHKDDILCVCYCPPHYLATGSFDGDIIVWNTDTEKIVSQFRSMARVRPQLVRGLRAASLASHLRTPACSRSSVSTPSRPASRRVSSYRRKANARDLQNVPVDQLLFLQSRVKVRVQGMATLVSSEGGTANFLDIFGKREPMGCIPLTQWEDESVLAMVVDPQDHILATGDTAGFIAVFDITTFCSASDHDTVIPDPVLCWRAHSGEVLSMQYVAHQQQPQLLSTSGDCTVKLWTLQGQYIGTFGQEHLWDARDLSTFQPDRTAEDETVLHDGATTINGPPDGEHLRPPVTTTITEEEDEDGGMEALSLGSYAVSPSSLPSPLTNKSLGEPYKATTIRRMTDRAERREQFSAIDLQSTERFGLLCTPYQALQLLNMDEETGQLQFPATRT